MSGRPIEFPTAIDERTRGGFPLDVRYIAIISIIVISIVIIIITIAAASAKDYCLIKSEWLLLSSCCICEHVTSNGYYTAIPRSSFNAPDNSRGIRGG